MKKLISAAFGTALFFASVVPSFAANSARNIDTGYKSLNIAAVIKLRRTAVDNPQTANVTNNVTTNTNTGHNETKNNTKVLGDVGTGDATANATVDTRVNDSLLTVNGCGCEGNNTALNEQTGAKSLNVAVIVDAQSIQVDNKQDAKVINNVTTRANSGHNTTNGNTRVEGGVGTGNATATANVTTVANISTITISP